MSASPRPRSRRVRAAGRAGPGRRSIPITVAGTAVAITALVLLATGPLQADGHASPTPQAAASPPAQAPTRPGTDPAPSPGPAVARDAVLAARDGFAAAGGATVAVFVSDGAPAPTGTISADSAERASSRHEAGWLADQPFPTASLVKLYLAEGLLHRARADGVPLSPEDGDVLDAMLTRSDDDAASRVWVRNDGPDLVTSVAARYALTATAPPSQRGEWGETTTSARDLGRFLTAIVELAHPDDAARVLGALARVTPAGADGFDQRFGLLAPGAAPAGSPAKQGWMCCVDGNRHLHSVGVVGDRVVVLLTQTPAGRGWTPARAALDAAAVAALSR